jgi:hypothetical protein
VPPKWDKLDAGLVNVDGLQATLNIAEDVLSPLIDALDILVSILNLVSLFVFGLPNVLQAIVEAAINTIEQMILDLLQNNVAFAVHLNMKWNTKWKFKKQPGDPSTTVDFFTDGEIPFTGTGTSGWLLDVGYSVHDSSNPFRPLTDADTAVSGVIFLKGVPADGEFENLAKIFDLFFNFKGFRPFLAIREKVENATEDFKALLDKLGPAALEEAIQEAVRPFEEVVQDGIGSLIFEGTFGTNAAGSSEFIDTAFGDAFEDVEVGDSLLLKGQTTFYNVIQTNAIDPTIITVEPPIIRAHGPDYGLPFTEYKIYRGGLQGLAKNFPTDLQSFLPKPGNYPIWVSIPVASLLPVVGVLLEELRKLANSLRVGLSQLEALQNLILLIQQKIELIRRAIEELNELLVLLLALLEFFDETYTINLNASEGGMGQFINTAIAAEGLPYFGERGVVVGMVAIATSDDPSNHLESFFELVGISFQDFSEDVTAAEEARQETWDDVFPP